MHPKKTQKLLIFTAFVACLLAFGTPLLADGGESKNPLFNEFNKPVDLHAVTASDITNAVEKSQADNNAALEKIYQTPDNQRTFKNTMIVLDNISDDLSTIIGTISLIANTHADSTIRTTARTAVTTLSQYANGISLDEKLYNAVKTYGNSEQVKTLRPFEKRFLDDNIRDFERNGFALSAEKREQLKTLQNELSEVGTSFGQNIATHQDELVVSAAEIDGLPEDYKKARLSESGAYNIDLSYPSYRPFMTYANSEKSRKALYMKFNNRAADKNLDVLQNLLKLREKMSTLLGYDTYATYVLGNRMAQTPEKVWKFEKALVKQLRGKAEKDYEELLVVKREMTNDKKASVINPWEVSYYRNILLKEKYQLDNEVVKEYFVLDNVLDGLFKITQHLFDLKYEEIKNPSTIHDEVRMYEVSKAGKLIGRFYLDLHPRANKYGHAACFPMIGAKATESEFQLPSATLVCNFPRATEDKPALMPHSQVITMFHEFGHVLHHLVSTAALSSQSGFNVSRDFVEAPSQIFENWTWNYEALSMFAKHYKTGEVIPKELFNKMLAAKNVGSGLNALQQVFYGTLDFTLHDKYDPNGDKTTTEVVKELQNEITLYPFAEGAHFQAAFGHLNGYGAGYYGYLWSKVYAQDMFSVFEKNGVMDQKTGIRYRDIILSKGATEDEIDLVSEFLDREPNQDAFLRSLGL